MYQFWEHSFHYYNYSLLNVAHILTHFNHQDLLPLLSHFFVMLSFLLALTSEVGFIIFFFPSCRFHCMFMIVCLSVLFCPFYFLCSFFPGLWDIISGLWVTLFWSTWQIWLLHACGYRLVAACFSLVGCKCVGTCSLFFFFFFFVPTSKSQSVAYELRNLSSLNTLLSNRKIPVILKPFMFALMKTWW